MTEHTGYGLHIKRFIDKVQALDGKNSKEMTLPMVEAKSLHADITKLLLENTALRNRLEQQVEDDVVSVEMTGGGF